MKTAEAVSSHILFNKMVITHSILSTHFSSLVWGMERPRPRKLGQRAYVTAELWASLCNRVFMVLAMEISLD